MAKIIKENIDVFKRLTKERIKKAHRKYENKPADSHTYGQVKSVNSDGSYQVQLNASSTTTRCAPFCTAGVGDRVLVAIKANGKCDAVGRLEGEFAEFRKPLRYSKPGMFHSAYLNAGTSGYTKICTVRKTGANRNAGIALVISKRGGQRCSIVHIVFANSSEASIGSLHHFSVDGPAGVYGVISGASMDVYVAKGDSYDNIALVDAWSNGSYMGDWLVADTAFVASLPSGYVTAVRTVLDDAYPVGAVYISYASTSPASLFGGTWTAITGRFPYFNAGTGTGGSNTHTLTVEQIPSHSHSSARIASNDSGVAADTHGATTWTSKNWLQNTGTTGGGGSHNNMPAYQTLYAWRRTA